jgi:hypothetical protein
LAHFHDESQKCRGEPAFTIVVASLSPCELY